MLVMLQDPTLAPRLVKHLQGNAPIEERIQAAMLARFLTRRLDSRAAQRAAGLLLALARELEGGNSYRGYLTNGANDVLKNMPPEEQLARIREGAKDPAAALGVVQNLAASYRPSRPRRCWSSTGSWRPTLRPRHASWPRRRSWPWAMATQRAAATWTKCLKRRPTAGKTWPRRWPPTRSRHEPARRGLAAAGPLADAWSKARRPATCCEPWPRFRKSNDKPQDQRQVILLGLKLGDNGGRDAAVLAGASGPAQKVGRAARARGKQSLAAWQKWFAEKYPESARAGAARRARRDSKWSFAAGARFPGQPSRQPAATPSAAQLVFEKAQCIKCHRYGTRGEGIGPDLSNVSSRFQKKEILESVVFPSLVISDQFAAKSVVTTDGKTYTGLVGPTGDGVVVLQANSEKVNVAKDDIEEIVPSKKSAMPDGLVQHALARGDRRPVRLHGQTGRAGASSIRNATHDRSNRHDRRRSRPLATERVASGSPCLGDADRLACSLPARRRCGARTPAEPARMPCHSDCRFAG